MERFQLSSPIIRSLRSIYRDDQGDFEELLEYGGFRYHLLLKFNNFEPNCIENIALQRVYDSMACDDEHDAVDHAAVECLDIFWPFIEADYESRLRSNPKPDVTDVIKLQVLTREGVLHRQEHNIHLEYPATKSIDNTFPQLPTFRSSEIERLREIESEIFQIKHRNSFYCLKTIHRTGHERNFIREVTILQECSHPNIICLIGLLVDENTKVEGMILEYIPDAKTLRSIDSISLDEFEKWAAQIQGAIAYLHRNHLVWGDAKAANVLIRPDGNVVLIDFGGGHTRGWVDFPNYESVNGDWQGCEQVIKFMRDKIK